MKFLIVVDMQNDFIDGALGTKEAVAILPAVKSRVWPLTMTTTAPATATKKAAMLRWKFRL